jgi:hypothetical protein
MEHSHIRHNLLAKTRSMIKKYQTIDNFRNALENRQLTAKNNGPIEQVSKIISKVEPKKEFKLLNTLIEISSDNKEDSVS